MLKIVLKRVATLILLGLTLAAVAQPLQVGESRPSWQATLLDSGQTLSNDRLQGHVVVINFWATWCEPCRAEMPLLEQFWQDHKDQGVVVLAISMDEARDLPKVRKMASAFSFAVAHKSQAEVKSLGRLWRLPSTFILDANGIVRKNGHIGDAMVSRQELEQIITPLLSEAHQK